MKKLVLITGAVLIACVFAGSFAASPQPRTAAAAIAETTAPQADGGFVIRDSGGRIAVFRRGESAPLLVTQTLTESRPRADAKKIREGIEVPDRQTLEKLLEDYCS